ncbi:hypothetical protein VSS74_02615 [Conexibacter stalactiti]|uniref:Uncharacterized protein n=1 Tax=Conexibacter stalactiti TaxID=1940611 RepID=A0ABU4HIR8_9ACTN|nr:hypothetical protein [Conexibacter stalactiti]MDW5593214.1 hypothetical protein [Conexibacter stalactiti]MEC5033855.1 hypothetical protein [Conexibacter stalactiti]
MRTTITAVRLRALAALCVALIAALAATATARAGEFGLEPDSFTASLSTAQAGGHPDVNVRFTLRNAAVDPSDPYYGMVRFKPFGIAESVVVDLPPGLVGDPTAAPRCPASAFPRCDLATQIGTVRLRTGLADEMWSPVFNVVPSQGAPAEFGFTAAGLLTVRLQVEVRSGGDYGLRTIIDSLPAIAPLIENDLTFWGVPADPSHDAMRGRACADLFGMGVNCGDEEGGNAATTPRAPFMTNATVCGPQPPVTLAVSEYANPGRPATAEAALPPLTGCDRLAFPATGRARATAPQAGAPSGYEVELTVPQNTDPDGIATPQLRQAVVQLPAGTVVSPAVADGLATCSDAQLALGAAGPVACPAASKIGEVSIDSPLLTQPLVGGVFLADPTPAQLLRLVLVAERDGVRLKLPGRIDADPVSGRLTATFDENPQLPFRSLRLTLKGGQRAVLANSRQCGPAESRFELTPYGGGAAAVSTDAFEVAGPCPAGFAPTLSAGSASAAAGAASPFTLTFGRGDGDDLLRSIDVALPAGVMPRIGEVPRCAEAQTVTGTCGEQSRVGSAQASAGPGAQPFGLPGRVYVAGAYRGAPYSLVIVVPAQAGPFDLGTVVVRAAVFVDLHTAALRIVSDPLPTILKGIPLQIRSVRIAIDRAGFMVNPTSCAPRAVGAAIAAAGGAVANASVRYQAAGCGSLPYTPRLRVVVGGRGRTAPRKPTALTATLVQPAGQAASRSVRLELPKAINARLEIVRRACSQAAYDAGSCGAAARIGSGAAVTSLLRDPLRGPAFFVRNPARALPDIVVQLRGDVAIDLIGKVTIRGGQLTTTFDTIPDVPLSRFSLTLPASSSPVGVASSGLCTRAARNARARQTLRAQNGKLVQRAAKLSIAGCKK